MQCKPLSQAWTVHPICVPKYKSTNILKSIEFVMDEFSSVNTVYHCAHCIANLIANWVYGQVFCN